MASKTTKVKYLLACGRLSVLVLSFPCVDCRKLFPPSPILAVIPQTTSLPSEVGSGREDAYLNSCVDLEIFDIVSHFIFPFIRRSLPAKPSQTPWVLCVEVCDLPCFWALIPWLFVNEDMYFTCLDGTLAITAKHTNFGWTASCKVQHDAAKHIECYWNSSIFT